MSVRAHCLNASPAKAGAQYRAARDWTPAFAGEAFGTDLGASGDAA